MTEGRSSSKWIHQRGNDSDMTGTRRGNVCSWLDVFGAADAMMARVLLACRGQELAGGITCNRNDQAVILVGRVPQSANLSEAAGLLREGRKRRGLCSAELEIRALGKAETCRWVLYG